LHTMVMVGGRIDCDKGCERLSTSIHSIFHHQVGGEHECSLGF
jgi:hypothetical protein